MGIDAVLLDMGGVLIPEIPDYSGAAVRSDTLDALRRLGVSNPEQVVVSAATLVLEGYRAARPDESFDPHSALAEHSAEVRNILLRAFVREVDRPPFLHAREVVVQLSRRYRLGLVSNNIFPGQHHARTLERYGVLSHLGSAVWSANFGPRKPDPSMLRHVLADLRVPASRAVFVGDKIRTDVHAARRAGVRSVWLRRNASPLPTGRVRPDWIIHDLRELPLLLRGLG
jgi:HAD superfamily hydrolase (TIGR01509 family)